MSLSIAAPFTFIPDAVGAPLDNGYVYIGTANQNPQTNPIIVYWDSAATIPAQQPLRTSGGFFYRNGTPSNVFISGTSYSITVRDSDQQLVYTLPNAEIGGASPSFTNVTITDNLIVGGDTILGDEITGGSTTVNLMQAGNEFTIVTEEGDTFIVDGEGNTIINVAEGDTFLVTGDGTTIFETPVEFHNTVDMSTATFVDYLNGSINFEDLSPELQNQILAAGSASSSGSGVSSGDGRLSLASGVRVMNQDYTGITTIYYVGGLILQLNSGTGMFSSFTIGELSQALSDTIYSPAAAVANKTYDIFGWKDTLSVTSMVRVGTTVTATTSGNHNITTGAVVFISGAVQSGYNGYHVLTSGSTNTFTFEVSTSPATPATGTITAATGRISRGPFWSTDFVRGTGAGTTEIELIENTYVNAEDITNGPAANMGTYLGSIRTNGSNQLDWIAGGSASGGVVVWRAVYNVSNQVSVDFREADTAAQWTWATAAWEPLNSSTNNRIYILRGLDDNPVNLSLSVYIATDFTPTGTAAGSVGIGLNVTNASADDCIASRLSASGAAAKSLGMNSPALYVGKPGLGWNYFQAIQIATSGTMAFGGGGGAGISLSGFVGSVSM